MRYWLLRNAKVLLLSAAAVVVVSSSSPASQRTVPSTDQLTKAPYEVRLRKLHLVRPDLIPYPVYFEVYC